MLFIKKIIPLQSLYVVLFALFQVYTLITGFLIFYFSLFNSDYQKFVQKESIINCSIIYLLFIFLFIFLSYYIKLQKYNKPILKLRINPIILSFLIVIYPLVKIPTIHLLLYSILYIGIAINFYNMTKYNLIICLNTFIFTIVLSGVLGGSFGRCFEILAILIIISIYQGHNYYKFKFFYIVLLLTIPVFLYPFKGEIRELSWNKKNEYRMDAPEFNPIKHLQNISEIVLSHTSIETSSINVSKDSYGINSKKEAGLIVQKMVFLLNRTSQFPLFTRIYEGTRGPSKINFGGFDLVQDSRFYYGDSFKPLLTKFIPRFLYSEKPAEDFLNRWAHDFYLLNPQDFSTSVIISTLPEFFINFGYYSIFLCSLAFLILNLLIYKFSIIWFEYIPVYVCLIFPFVLNEGNFSSLVGGVFINILALLIIFSISYLIFWAKARCILEKND